MNIRFLLWSLAFTAGFVDTATFLGPDGIFSAHVTGNFVVFAANVFSGSDPEIYSKLLSFPVFALGVLVVRLKPLELSKYLGIISLFILAAGLLNLSPLVLVFAMALQNAIQKIHLKALPASTVMTGNVTSIFLGAPLVTSEIVLAFLIGCLAGAGLTVHFGSLALILPGALTLFTSSKV